MNLADIMDAVAERLMLIPDLHVSATPGGPVAAPMATVHYPLTYAYDATYGRGLDSLELVVAVNVSLSNPTAARAALSRFTAGDGTYSVKAAIEGAGTLLEGAVTPRVASVEFATETVSGQPYLTADFTVQLTGPGLEP